MIYFVSPKLHSPPLWGETRNCGSLGWLEEREQRRQVSEVLLEGLYGPAFNPPKLRGSQSIMRDVWEMLIDNCDADHYLNWCCDTAISSLIDFLLGDSLHQSFTWLFLHGFKSKTTIKTNNKEVFKICIWNLKRQNVKKRNHSNSN